MDFRVVEKGSGQFYPQVNESIDSWRYLMGFGSSSTDEGFGQYFETLAEAWAYADRWRDDLKAYEKNNRIVKVHER